MSDVGLTLGAHRRAKAIGTTPWSETLYWLPCFFQIAEPEKDEHGKLVPHVYFVTSNLAPHVRCPACRRGT